ncbi:hypothetical protein HYU96_02040 [Candidatus Daviesbacteria bacterium]|nr:hypothetical protein [Candidatus Daviesbacteria bacterium]
MNKLFQTFRAVKVVLKNPKYLTGWLVLSLAILGLFIYIPIKNIPGNDFTFQLSIMTLQDKILTALLAMGVSLSLVMNIYAFKLTRSKKLSISIIGQSGGGFLSGVVASIFGTATCAACVFTLFGFLGTAGVFFLLEYRTWIVLISLIILLISLYFISAKVLGICRSCGIKV